MGWMWGLLAIVVVLVVVGLLVARSRRAPAARDDDAVPGGRPEVPGSAGHSRAGGPGVDDAARAEGAPGAWDDGDRPAVPAGSVPEQAGPVEPPPAGTAGPDDEDPEPGPTGRHALREDVEPRPLPEIELPEQAGPPEPLPVASRSGAAATANGGAGGSALAALDSQLIGPAGASDPVPAGARPGPFPGSVLAPEDGSDPPETHQVKVHSGSRRFHTPESPYYVRTRADLYFAEEGAARAAGFTAWNERPTG